MSDDGVAAQQGAELGEQDAADHGDPGLRLGLDDVEELADHPVAPAQG